MAGGGGSFLIMPFYILIGLTPQQAVATGKFGGFGLSLGAVAAFKRQMLAHKHLSLLAMGLALAASIAGSILLPKVNNQHLQFFMGLLMLLMVPFMIDKSRITNNRSASDLQKVLGGLVLAVVLFLQALLSSGVGALVSVIFMIFFGLGAVEANAMKRKTSLILTTVMPLALLGSGLINFTYGVMGIAGGLAGGYIGSRIAIKRGDEFTRYVLLILVIISGVWLMASA